MNLVELDYESPSNVLKFSSKMHVNLASINSGKNNIPDNNGGLMKEFDRLEVSPFFNKNKWFKRVRDTVIIYYTFSIFLSYLIY